MNCLKCQPDWNIGSLTSELIRKSRTYVPPAYW